MLGLVSIFVYVDCIPRCKYILDKMRVVFGSATAPHVGRYAFRPVSTTETVAEPSSEDEMTEKILLGWYKYCAV